MSQAAKRTVRTVLQTAVGLLLLLPAIAGSAGLSQTLPWLAGALAVSGGLARVMALPGVEAVLPSWLRATARPQQGAAAPAGADEDRSSS